MAEPRTVVIGVGNPDGGDDAVGPAVIAGLRDRPREPGVRLVECRGDLTRLLDLWDGVPRAIVVDAVVSGRPAGEVRRWGPGSLPATAASSAASSHGLSVSAAWQLGDALGRRPAHLVLYTVEAGESRLGAPLSEKVRAGVREVIDRVAEELGGPGSPG